MLTLTSVEAQSRFGELIDRSQREPVQVTRRGRPVAYVICDQDMQTLNALNARREAASTWYAQYRASLAQQQASDLQVADALTDEQVTQLVHELR
ncbi:MAG TPA: type II toxin-antitoxin system prevent-host-death family antitoxin [Rhodoferax sp.]